MPTQRPLEELLVTLQTQGDLLDVLASSALSSERFLRYRRQQNLLLMRSREQLMQAKTETQVPVSITKSAESESQDSPMLSLSQPPRKRANRRARRPTKPRPKTNSEQLPDVTSPDSLENPQGLIQADFEELMIGLPLSSEQPAIDSSVSEPEDSPRNIDRLIRDWAINPTPMTSDKLCKMRLYQARQHATKQRWSEALSAAHHAYELQPKSVEVVEACLHIAEQAALAQQVEYFLQRQAELQSS